MASLTLPRPAPSPDAAAEGGFGRHGAPSGPDRGRRRVRRAGGSSSLATLVVAAGSALAMAPISAIFTDWMWLWEAWGGLACVAVVLAVLRIGRKAMLVDEMIAIVVLAGYIVAVHLSAHAWAGLIPTGQTFHDLADLQNRAAQIIDASRPPVRSTPSLRVLSTPLLVLVAIVIDALAVVGRSRAVAGLPILAVIAAAASIARTQVGIVGFLIASAGYLLILAAGTERERRDWTDAAPVHASAPGAGAARGATGARIAVAALVVAVILPIFAPMAGTDGLSGIFARHGSGGGVSLSPFAKLQGSLNQKSPTNLLKVTVAGDVVEPFYLRDIVLDTYTSKDGWTSSGDGKRSELAGPLVQSPPAGAVEGTSMSATVDVLGLADSSAPTFGTLSAARGLGSGWVWNSTTATVSGGVTSKGSTYQLSFTQPTLTADQLRAAPAGSGAGFERWLKLPDDLPAIVGNTTQNAIAGAATPFDEVLAINQYFDDPANGFIYSTTTKSADTGDGLSDFLSTKIGYCQQYAGAMAVMVRELGIPARVVLGYTHEKADENGSFTVTSHDAHAWVEAYFGGIGWVPFDPTPLSGDDAGRAVSLPYASTGAADSGDGGGSTTPGASAAPSAGSSLLPVPDEFPQESGPIAGSVAAGDSRRLEVWLVIAALLVIALSPAAARIAQRRRRARRAARDGTVWPWWDEYRATATDLGVSWSAAATLQEIPGQVRTALRFVGDGSARRRTQSALAELLVAAERERFARPGAQPQVADPKRLGAAAVRELRGAASRRQRIGAWFAPRSTVRPVIRGAVRAAQQVTAAPGRLLRRRTS
jgi:hypothetical protein